MELISQIINELIDSNKSLEGALLKTKVLASRIQNKELIYWVNSELSGYKPGNILPDYRKNIFAFIKGNYVNGGMKYSNHPIPITGIDEEFQKSLNRVNFHESISGLESIVNDNDSQILGAPIPAEVIGLISDNWRSMGNPYLQVISANRVIPKSVIVEIISKIRNKLLDFMLKVDEQFGSLSEIEKLKTKTEEISTIMSQTIINNTGDGNILNTGDKAKIVAKINISKGSKEELVNYLQENGISEEDTTELISIIDTEEPNLKKKAFGKKVGNWTKNMISKAVDGTWDVGIGAAGTILAEAIGKFYGF